MPENPEVLHPDYVLILNPGEEFSPSNPAESSGRNISSTSQSMLHITAAISYQIFAWKLQIYMISLYYIPAVIIGSLTVIVIFGLVRLFAGTAAGLFASLFFAMYLLPIIA